MSKTIYVATPCMNAIETIDRTIQSVVTQAGRFRVRYHVQDGGSTDGTIERLAWWQSRLRQPTFPFACEGVDFSYTSEPDTGMYDAIIRCFDRLVCFRDAFIGWINADDVFMHGTFALIHAVDEQFPPESVSWVGGSVAIMKDDMIISAHDRRIPTAALSAGLCDGTHWPFMQQEGTFFRRWLWDAVKPKDSLKPLKVAGDWNLWRLFAQRASLVQFGMPLGAFRIRDQQLSAKYRDRCIQEIESLVPTARRQASLEQMARDQCAVRRRLHCNYPEVKLFVVEEDCEDQLQASCMKVFKVARPIGTSPHRVKRAVFEGDPKWTRPEKSRGVTPEWSFERGIAAFDRDWQYPAISEKHAFDQLKSLGGTPPGVLYVAFPWATLIDKIQTRAPDGDEYLETFRRFVRSLPQEGVRVTVCQHILMKRFLPLLVDAGISHVFWTHATHEDAARPQQGIRVHPFPLFAVQLPADGSHDLWDDSSRCHLFSFIGAKPNQYYMTQVRAWILDVLKDVPDGLIVGRDNWHYHKVVYEHQMRAGGPESPLQGGSLVDNKASTDFQASLRESTFSLCPSGSGPNSIRLWESIGAGAVPVILADTYLPPGPRPLWDEAVVFCSETLEAVRALPERLRAIAAEPGRLPRMRQALRQLWLLYGRDSFITDLLRLMHELAPRRTITPAQGAEEAGALEALDAQANTQPMSESNARVALALLGTQLLTRADSRAAVLIVDGRWYRLRERALSSLSPEHPSRQAFERAMRAAPLTAARSTQAAPVVVNRLHRAPTVAFFGRHRNRTPLSYAPIRRSVGAALEFVDDPARADILLTGFDIDFTENTDGVLNAQAAHPRQRLVVMSEEPLWDLTWSRARGQAQTSLDIGGKPIAVYTLNHDTSAVFRFRQLPYFVLTSDDYLVRYRQMLAPAIRRSAREMLAFWRQGSVHSAFYLEKRQGQTYEKRVEGSSMFGLSVHRTLVAERTRRGLVTRVGKGWTPDRHRQALTDWHLDKLAALKGRTHLCSAIENVHHCDYISEKIFDAYAVGAVPIYCAAPDHRIGELLPDRPFVAVSGVDAQADADAIDQFVPDEAFCERYEAAQQRLYELVGDWRAVADERARVAHEAVRSLLALL